MALRVRAPLRAGEVDEAQLSVEAPGGAISHANLADGVRPEMDGSKYLSRPAMASARSARIGRGYTGMACRGGRGVSVLKGVCYEVGWGDSWRRYSVLFDCVAMYAREEAVASKRTCLGYVQLDFGLSSNMGEKQETVDFSFPFFQKV